MYVGMVAFTNAHVFCTVFSSSDVKYDPDKHCGVWIMEQERHCTRSLSCKVSVALLSYSNGWGIVLWGLLAALVLR